jgi:hypothetical protein
VSAVKGYVKAMFEMITGAKEEEIKDAMQGAVHQHFSDHGGRGDRPEMYKQEEGFGGGGGPSMMEEASFGAPEMMAMSYSAPPEAMMSRSMAGSMAPIARGDMRMARSKGAPQRKSRQVEAVQMSAVQMFAPVPAPKPAVISVQVQAHPRQPVPVDASGEEGAVKELDMTTIPAILDAKFETLDTSHALRPTTIKLGEYWERTSLPALLGRATTSTLREFKQTEERNKTFDLLDALTRSGVLAIEHASLHVVLLATHNFDQGLVETVIQQNVNAIEKVEQSQLIVASVVHGVKPAQLLNVDQVARLQEFSPVLFDGDLAVFS